ncbi:MAG: aromatic ring-hydroxylating dioxygenase subunit alpha [Proteobacteria bacterium]|nr:aromatic ring-hydroxylating dioxygenase subunit alpha [Pseudomonadota bacterium]
MTKAQGEQTVEALAARHRRGFTLEQPFYNDPAIFARDLEQIVSRQWLLVDHASRLGKAGDWVTFAVAGESIVLVRGRDGEIRGFFNVCRHRGSRICLTEEGNSRTLTCPYHAWVWNLEGQLQLARGMAADFDRDAWPLHACQVRVWHGLIFVNLAAEGDPEVLPFETLAADCEPYLAREDLGRTRIAARIAYPTHANWKLVLENFQECHHCAPSHPEYTAVHSYVTEEPRDPAGWWERHQSWQGARRAAGLHAEIAAPYDADPRQPHGGWYAPIRPGIDTLSRDGKPLAPLLGSHTAFDGVDTGICLGQFGFAHVCNDHAVLFRFTPRRVDLTDVELIWLVHEDAVEGRDYDRDRLTWLWDITTIEDTKIINDNQAGVNSSRYAPGPYVPAEAYAQAFIDWYVDRIGGQPAPARADAPPARDFRGNVVAAE